MASYPGAIKSWSALVDNVDLAEAANVNTVYDEVTAVQTELGADVAGTATDLVTRLAASLDGLGNLDFATASALTISTGSITPTQNWHSVDTEGSTDTDDLATIVATNCTDGFILVLRQANSARDITIKHATGNIYCPGAADITMTLSSSVVMLIYDATNTIWEVIGTLNAAFVNVVNTFTAEQVYAATVRHSYTSSSSDITLAATYEVANIDASGGGITITLPAAANIAGRQYTIRKSDASANAVTVDGNASETINGAATYALTTQYQSVTIMSDGTNWMII